MTLGNRNNTAKCSAVEQCSLVRRKSSKMCPFLSAINIYQIVPISQDCGIERKVLEEPHL